MGLPQKNFYAGPWKSEPVKQPSRLAWQSEKSETREPQLGYNSLMDPNLALYFNNPRIRKHLRQTGLILPNGEAVTEGTYRLYVGKLHKHEQMEQLLMEAVAREYHHLNRSRQAAINQKMDELRKMELVNRIREEGWKNGASSPGQLLSRRPSSRPPLLVFTPKPKAQSRLGRRRTTVTPRNEETKRSSSAPQRRRERRYTKNEDEDERGSSRKSSSTRSSSSSSRKDRRRTSSSSSASSASSSSSSSRSLSPSSKSTVDGRGGETFSESSVSQSRSSRSSSVDHPPKRSAIRIPDEKSTTDDSTASQYSFQDDFESVTESSRSESISSRSSLVPHPPPKDEPRCPSRSKSAATASKNRRRMFRNQSELQRQSLKPGRQPRLRHNGCLVTLHFFGVALALHNELADKCSDIVVEQQHCGGNTVTVFKDRVPPGSDFAFYSYRRSGYPFSVTIYVGGRQDSRLSTCCEYKHLAGVRLGGIKGHFGMVGVKGGQPCFKCQLAKKSQADGRDKGHGKDRKGRAEKREDSEDRKRKDKLDGKKEEEEEEERRKKKEDKRKQKREGKREKYEDERKTEKSGHQRKKEKEEEKAKKEKQEEKKPKEKHEDKRKHRKNEKEDDEDGKTQKQDEKKEKKMEQGQRARRRNKTQGNQARSDSSDSEIKEKKGNQRSDRSSDSGSDRGSDSGSDRVAKKKQHKKPRQAFDSNGDTPRDARDRESELVEKMVATALPGAKRRGKELESELVEEMVVTALPGVKRSGRDRKSELVEEMVVTALPGVKRSKGVDGGQERREQIEYPKMYRSSDESQDDVDDDDVKNGNKKSSKQQKRNSTGSLKASKRTGGTILSTVADIHSSAPEKDGAGFRDRPSSSTRRHSNRRQLTRQRPIGSSDEDETRGQTEVKVVGTNEGRNEGGEWRDRDVVSESGSGKVRMERDAPLLSLPMMFPGKTERPIATDEANEETPRSGRKSDREKDKKKSSSSSESESETGKQRSGSDSDSNRETDKKKSGSDSESESERKKKKKSGSDKESDREKEKKKSGSDSESERENKKKSRSDSNSESESENEKKKSGSDSDSEREKKKKASSDSESDREEVRETPGSDSDNDAGKDEKTTKRDNESDRQSGRRDSARSGSDGGNHLKAETSRSSEKVEKDHLSSAGSESGFGMDWKEAHSCKAAQKDDDSDF